MNMAPNIPQLLTTIAGFLLLMWILRKFAWGPIIALIDQRRAKIETDYSAAEKELADAGTLRASFEAKLGEIKVIERQRVQEAVKKGEELAKGIVADARAEIEQVKAKGMQDLEIESQKAQLELRKSVVTLAIGAAEKLIGERLDDAKHRQLIQQYIDRIEELPHA
ncbi:MAG TPA: F0F1 ATP synthase subunit B [Candidatus Krumholzibacteria bacterium]|nr:F0F1 ATP synthase subunit B [Candidatus Krumholzibacteria bacterium]HPD73029.1 F0F1 ATP synthase subunit B [Candidatus Krumholzibacteria bacterium]HRY41828.1 F0F1 ATP synthase subunit B [Candidatus Krumholzibacteria bacterium]